MQLCALHQSYAAPVQQLPEGAKIVVIGGALTEIVYALHAESQIIGRDTTSTYPEAARTIQDVGYMRALSPEGLFSLSPQGILLVEGSGPPETLEVLQKASVPIVTIPEGYNRESVILKIKRVGFALHKEQEAQALTEKIDQQFAQIDQLIGQIKTKKRVLFILSFQNGRIMAAGQNTAANGIIEMAGGINAIQGYSGYKALNDEAIINAKPDYILAMSNAGMPLSADELLTSPAIAMTPAGRAKAFYQMDGLFLLGFGPRTARASKILTLTLYPDINNPHEGAP